ncbi:hypothetical protein FBY22_7126 [Streptomyces sp. SLBN-31]|nr:hypothetical protein FBY22_7126 [Streptomyces sp. SLBN-31]
MIWRTNCWKQVKDAKIGIAAAALPMRSFGAWAIHKAMAMEENTKTTHQECKDRRRCSAWRRMDSDATSHGPKIRRGHQETTLLAVGPAAMNRSGS